MLARHSFFVRLGLAPALLNLLINFVIGLWLFADVTRVPWLGSGSAGNDLMIGVTIVALISALATTPKVARGAAAGLVAGLPEQSLWRLLPARPLLLVLVVSVGVAGALWLLTYALASVAPTGLSASGAALFKGVTCAVGGHLAIVFSGLRTLVGAPDRTRERTAAIAAARGLVGQPLDSLDKGCLACTDRTRGISVAPVWHLVIDGDIDDAVLAAALAATVARYPWLATRVVPVDGLPEFARDFRYVAGDPPRLETCDLPIDSAMKQVFDHHIDVFAEPPVRFVRVREPGRLHLLIQQHHASADGRAFIGLLCDWAANVRALEQGEPVPTGEVPRRGEREALGRGERVLRRLQRRGFARFIRESLALKLRPLEALPWNRGRDYQGVNRAVRAVLQVSQLESLRSIREAAGVSLNSLLTAAYLRAIKTWAAPRGQTLERLVCEVIVETRPRDGTFVSFANHLSAYLAEVRGAALTDLLSCARAVQAAVAKEAASEAHLERALFRGWGVHTVSIDVLRHLVLDIAELRAQVGFSNLVALPIPELAGRDWRVRDVWVTTPAAPPHGIALTATSYAGRIAFNFNYKASVIAEPEVRALADLFVTELRSLGAPLDCEPVVH